MEKQNKNIFYIYLTLFWHFFQPSLASKLSIIGLIFVQWAGLEKLGYEHAFQPYTYSIRLFSWGLYINSDPPPAFIGLKDVSHVNLTLHSIDKRYLQICATVSLQDLPNNLRRPKFKELPHRFTKIPFPLQLHMRKISSFFERYILCM